MPGRKTYEVLWEKRSAGLALSRLALCVCVAWIFTYEAGPPEGVREMVSVLAFLSVSVKVWIRLSCLTLYW